jgi:hypothetical protein
VPVTIAGTLCEVDSLIADHGQRTNAPIERGRPESREPWFRFILTFDPRPTQGEVRCRLLVMNGGN